MAQPYEGLSQGHARIVEETINPSLLFILDIPAVTLPPKTLDLLSNTGPESCSNPFSSQCLWYCLKSDHLITDVTSLYLHIFPSPLPLYYPVYQQ